MENKALDKEEYPPDFVPSKELIDLHRSLFLPKLSEDDVLRWDAFYVLGMMRWTHLEKDKEKVRELKELEEKMELMLSSGDLKGKDLLDPDSLLAIANILPQSLKGEREKYYVWYLHSKIDGLITSIAVNKVTHIVDTPNKKESFFITEGGRFTSEMEESYVKSYLVDDFRGEFGPTVLDGVDVFVGKLHQEMVEFFRTSRDREWGQIMTENHEIKVIVNEGGFPTIPKIT